MKRFLDILMIVLAAPVWLPLSAAVALAVRIGMGRPVIFRQARVGQGGQSFVLMKFRSMSEDRGRETGTGCRMPDVGCPPPEGSGTFEAGCTTRVTRVGRILRKWKLDELPQLWNVLMGDMSLVGPRPEISKWVEAYPERWAKVLTVRPGITDPASIEFRNEEELLAAAADPERHYREVVLPRKLELYEEYVQTRSLWGDIGIVFKTFFVLVRKI